MAAGLALALALEAPARAQEPATEVPPPGEAGSPGAEARTATETEAEADAATEASPTDPTTLPMTTEAKDLEASDELIGEVVISADGERVGEIQELLVRPDDNTVHHVVVEVGGVLGIGAKPVAIDTEYLARERDTRVWVSNLTAEQIEQLPEFVPPS